MQTEYLLSPRYYQARKIRVSTLDADGQFRLDAVLRFERAMAKGLKATDAAVAVGVPRSTLFCWAAKKKQRVENLKTGNRRPRNFRQAEERPQLRLRIQQLRDEHPTWGKRKITSLLRREGETVSESRVGRIISDLLRRGVIESAQASARRAGARLRPKRPYAQRLKRGQRLKSAEPGGAVQVDHMSVELRPGATVKHFNAVCTVSRWNVADGYSCATASTASEFVEKVITEMPFPIKCIQVDGGSEFMAEFEEACQQHGIELFVLAAKSPKLNGHVERINGTWRTDFYELYDLPSRLDELREQISNYQETYNWDRPHDSLGLQTPQEFLEARKAQLEASQSQV